MSRIVHDHKGTCDSKTCGYVRWLNWRGMDINSNLWLTQDICHTHFSKVIKWCKLMQINLKPFSDYYYFSGNNEQSKNHLSSFQLHYIDWQWYYFSFLLCLVLLILTVSFRHWWVCKKSMSCRCKVFQYWRIIHVWM